MAKDKFLPIDDILIYWECQCKDYTNDADVTITHHSIYMAVEEEWKLKPYLRPMHTISDDELLAVCELADHTPFLSKKKWEIDRKRDDVIYIKSKRSEFSFAVYISNKTGYGDISIFREYDREPKDFDPKNPDAVDKEPEPLSNIGLITKFYLDHYLDCFGWIDQNLAIDKTKVK